MADDEKRDWKAETEEALKKTGDSLAAAWEATREGRMKALEKAREAVKQLGEAIDEGVSTARKRWGGDAAGEATADTSESAEEASTEEE